MAFDTLVDTEISRDKPADSALMLKLKNRDDWNKSGATASSDFFVDAYQTGHSHDGTSGEGAQIPEAGIADTGVVSGGQVGSAQVTTAKLKNSTMGTSHFQDSSVTTAKMTGKIGTQFRGLVTGGALDVTITHGLGHRPVVTNRVGGAFAIQSTSSTSIVLQYKNLSPPDPWSYDIHAV